MQYNIANDKQSN